jgi:hypothetical protein
VLNNNRFLIFLWVQVANLASHVLAQTARRAADDWQQRWGYPPYCWKLLSIRGVSSEEIVTVVPARKLLGCTTGEGLVRGERQYQTSPKLIFVKPLLAKGILEFLEVVAELERAGVNLPVAYIICPGAFSLYKKRYFRHKSARGLSSLPVRLSHREKSPRGFGKHTVLGMR